MAFKKYEDEIVQSKLGFRGRYKAGFTGRDHKTARAYWNCSVHEVAKDPSYTGTLAVNFNWKNGTSSALSRIQQDCLYNRVLSKLEGKCGASSSLGSSIFAEGGESVKQAVKNLEELAAIARGIRRKDVAALKRVWQRNRRPTTAMKAAGGRWLEFSFGWAPLVQTVHDGMKATGSDWPKMKISAGARTWVSINTSGIRFQRGFSRQSLRLGCDVKVSNPNTWLLGRLDFLNPGIWLWEAIPMSFFVDYFVNVDEMIQNLSSFAGLSLSNHWATRSHREVCECYRKQGSGTLWVATHEEQAIVRATSFSTKRKYTLQELPLTSSWRRGANASAFLAQFMRNH